MQNLFDRRAHARFGLVCLLVASSVTRPRSAEAQEVTQAANANPDYVGEAFVIEHHSLRIQFENDGKYQREQTAKIRMKSDAGVQRYAVLSFPYQGATENLAIEYVRVRKVDGSVVTTQAESAQDMPAEITRQAPFYSDLREKHLAVKGLGVGDVLEFKGVWQTTNPLAPGQFWYAYNFDHENICLQSEIEINVPRERGVKWKSRLSQPITREEYRRKIFRWTYSQISRPSPEDEQKEKERTTYEAGRGKLEPPDIQITSFQSWEEVGKWYAGLQQERVKASPEIRAKAAEITKGQTEAEGKIRAIYGFVGTQFHYIGVAFGIGRYQPHAANEVLSNQYGDCKDKHTLLAALLDAVGVKASAALIASAHEVDPDVPSPGQFDHVISVVTEGDRMVWLDSTPGVAPFGYLPSNLRNKPALVVREGEVPRMANTPAEAGSSGKIGFKIEAKLNESGTLEGKIERTLQGYDAELLLRIGFRSLPLTQWKELVQQLSFSSGFGGEVSHVEVSSPEKTDEPFHITYSYKRKEYPDWANHRVSSPLPPMGLPVGPEQGKKPSYPLLLGDPLEVHFESRVEFPAGYAPNVPLGLDLTEEFAEYHASYELKDGALVTKRDLVVKKSEVPVGEYEVYKKFSEAVNEDHDLYIALTNGNSPTLSYQQAIWSLPETANADAARAYEEARGKFEAHDVPGQINSLKRAVGADPKFIRAWLWLGELFRYTGQEDQALKTFRQAIDNDPTQAVSYKALGTTLVGMKKFEEAVKVWQELVKRAPNDSQGLAGLAASLGGLKRYGEAVAPLEAAIKHTPQIAALHAQLGSAYLHSGDEEKALSAYQKAVELDQRAVVRNDIAWELAEAKKQLPTALRYAQQAVSMEEDASGDVELEHLQMEDLGHTLSLVAFWDTLGWVYFRMEKFEEAEKYINAAWMLSQRGEEADRLAQVYEGEKKRQAAAHMYKVALYCYPQQSNRDGDAIVKTEERLERLTPKSSTAERYNFTEISQDVNSTRTVKIGHLTAEDASAEFFLLLSGDTKMMTAGIEDTRFISGSDELRSAGDSLKEISLKFPFPDDGGARVLRRVKLACHKGFGCTLTLVKLDDVRSVQ
jgi:tetratricopeptide (TPR) repeat protein